MSTVSRVSDIALELANQAQTGGQKSGISAAEWLKAGAAIGAIKSGSRALGRSAQRNPKTSVTAIAAVLGLGVIGYLVYRRNQRDNALARQLAQQQTAAAIAQAQAKQGN